MAKIHVYLNFNGNCKDAFEFYSQVFSSPVKETFLYDDMPIEPNSPALPDHAKGKVMHTSLMVNDTTMLMGADVVEGFGGKLVNGNSAYVMLEAKDKEESTMLFQALSKNAKTLEMELGETFFAESFASLEDNFGIYWMIYFEGNKKMD